jgi:outer membrane protein OmpA-like peptidoglycan-associated protein
MRLRSAPRRSPKARSRLPQLLAALAAAITASSGASALAADCQATPILSSCIDADNLWPHASGGFFSMGSALTTPANKSAFGLVASYLSRPIGLRVASPDPDGTVLYAIDNVVDTTFLWALGVTDRLELTLALPVTLYQDGSGLADVLGTDDALPRSVVRDGRFGASFALLPRPRTGSGDGLALTGRLQFGAPFGAREAFASAGVVTAVPSITADLRLGRLLIAADIGGRIRNNRVLAGATVGSQVTAALGASFDILPARWLTASAEAFGLYTLASQKPSVQSAAANESAAPLVPAEWIASISSAPFLGGDFVLALGGGGSIPLFGSSALTTPRFRFNAALRYAPTGRDADGDGVLDRDDKCVHKPEDRDGFQDEDGCPEPDNDNDRIPDDRDRCRDEAETVDGFQDDDGCPDNDDDKDKVLDASDVCRNAPEDMDKFEDDDGCPEPDNDRDGILDGVDLCPNGAEDRDGFKDEDGCPDLDNDLDQVNDDLDQCKTLAEDRDRFQDDDGCPEPDNDEDGILDGADKCATSAETINGDADGDGCPEPGATSLVRFDGPRPIAEKLARFPAGSADVSKDLEKQLVMMAQLIRGRAPLELVIVEAFADRSGDSSDAAVALADKRASAVKAIFAAHGIPADKITAATGDLASKRPAGAPLIEVTVTRARTEDKRR